jgi:hypothetical protein
MATQIKQAFDDLFKASEFANRLTKEQFINQTENITWSWRTMI